MICVSVLGTEHVPNVQLQSSIKVIYMRFKNPKVKSSLGNDVRNDGLIFMLLFIIYSLYQYISSKQASINYLGHKDPGSRCIY